MAPYYSSRLKVRSVLPRTASSTTYRRRYASTTACYIYCGYVGAPLDTSLWCQVETIMIARDHNIHPYCPPLPTLQYIAVDVYNPPEARLWRQVDLII